MDEDRDYDSSRFDNPVRAFGGRSSKKVVGKLGLKADVEFNYTDPQLLKHFMTERGRILPRRLTGLDAKQQRRMTRAIKRARQLALLPYVGVA